MRTDLRCIGLIVRRCPIGGVESVNFHTIHNAKPVQRSDQDYHSIADELCFFQALWTDLKIVARGYNSCRSSTLHSFADNEDRARIVDTWLSSVVPLR